MHIYKTQPPENDTEFAFVMNLLKNDVDNGVTTHLNYGIISGREDTHAPAKTTDPTMLCLHGLDKYIDTDADNENNDYENYKCDMLCIPVLRQNVSSVNERAASYEFVAEFKGFTFSYSIYLTDDRHVLKSNPDPITGVVCLPALMTDDKMFGDLSITGLNHLGKKIFINISNIE